jgi:branched-chain amino acid transport system permease protein
MNTAIRASHVRSSAYWAGAVAYIGATMLLAHGSNYNQGLLLVAAVFAILALSLDLVAGMLGLYSLGQAGLFAIGAYSTTILSTTYHWNVFLALPVVVVVGAVLGVIIGALALRVSGLYFAITTFVFTLIVGVVVSDSSITGGYQGLAGPSFPNFPRALSGMGTALVWAVSGALLITVVIIWSIRSSAIYPVLLAIRDAEPFAASAGVKTAFTRVMMFSLSSALAGLAGWTFCFLGYITPGQFNGTATINILVMVILGGMNTRLGPIVGAVFISLFPVVVTWNPLWQEVLFGAIFIFVIVFFPEGVVGIVARVGRLVRRRLHGEVLDIGGDSLPGAPPPVSTPVPPHVEHALAARNITFQYLAGVPVLENIDFLVRPGTIHGLIGPNGSGKSTMVNLICGQLSPTSGTIELQGERVDHMPAYQRPAMGLMRTYQTAVMVREISTRDNVSIGLFHQYRRMLSRSLLWPLLPSGRRDTRDMHRLATAALNDVGLSAQWEATRVADIPHGVEQLTQLAAACVARPSVLVLDEPLAGLSHGEIEEVATILRRLRDQGVTTIVVEHQTRFVFDVCDDVTVLAAGQLIKTGSASDVRVDERVREVYLGQ